MRGIMFAYKARFQTLSFLLSRSFAFPKTRKRVNFPWCLPRTNASSCARKCSYTAQKNRCITIGLRVRFALENVLRFAADIPRMRESSHE